jgi:hypothetical protein
MLVSDMYWVFADNPWRSEMEATSKQPSIFGTRSSKPGAITANVGPTQTAGGPSRKHPAEEALEISSRKPRILGGNVHTQTAGGPSRKRPAEEALGISSKKPRIFGGKTAGGLSRKRPAEEALKREPTGALSSKRRSEEVPSKRRKLEKDSDDEVLMTVETDTDTDSESGSESESEDSRNSPPMFRIASKRRELILGTLDTLERVMADIDTRSYEAQNAIRECRRTIRNIDEIEQRESL